MKNILSLFLFFCITIVCEGQISAGARLGLNFASWSLDPSFSAAKDPAILPHVGAIVNFEISEKFSIQPEIVFSQKGMRFANNTASSTFKMDYLEVPVLLKFSFGNESVKGFVNGGTFLGYALKQKVVDREDGKLIQKLDVTFDNNLEDDSIADRRLDFGWALGAGVQFATGPGDVFIEVRYDFSISDLVKLKVVPADYTKLRNKVFMISIGYLLPLRRE